MTFKFACAAAALLTATLAQAQTPEIPGRATLYSADGTKIGRVDSVLPASDGTPQAVRLIYRGKFVTIPASTLSAAEKGLKTSLTNAELKRM